MRLFTQFVWYAHAGSDQRKHIETAVDNRLPCTGEEKAASPKRHRRLELLILLPFSAFVTPKVTM